MSDQPETCPICGARRPVNAWVKTVNLIAAQYDVDPQRVFDGKTSSLTTRVRHAAMFALRQQGMSFREIAALAGVDHKAVFDGVKRHVRESEAKG